MQVDPVASFQCWAIEIELAGRTFEVPALPASEWFPVLLEGDPLGVLDMVVSSQAGDVDDLLLSGEIGKDELETALLAAIEAVAGREMWPAFVLAQVAQMHWPTVSGQLVKSGFRWDRAPLGAALDAIYALAVAGMDETRRTEFHALLDRPMPGRAGAARPAAAVESFETLAGPKPTGGVRATAELSGSARPRSQPRSQLRRPAGRSPAPTTRPG